MASLKAIRKRITSVKSTQKITKAMKMVSAAKLRRAQDAATSARPYADKLSELLRSVVARAEAAGGDTAIHPLLQTPAEERRVHVLLVTSDRGLCGGYNANLIRKAEIFLQEHGREHARMTVVGRRGFDYFKRRGVTIADKHINLFGGPTAELALSIGTQLAGEFAAGTVDGVYIVYSAFRSALVQTPTLLQLLPVPTAAGADHHPIDYLYEPSAAELLDRLVRRYITVLIHRAFLEAMASEHGARMTAMESATNNAADMINRLTLDMNRARQATITKELMEIVGGAEALKG
jgi:F-type H+-transporting ATPase subunit gamma